MNPAPPPERPAAPAGVDCSMAILAPPSRVIGAFFDAEALSVWWRTSRSVTIPRILGPYALEWEITDHRDEVLGRLGGTFRGTVMEFKAERRFFVADIFWLPPDGDPLGPMALEVVCERQWRQHPEMTLLKVAQRGFEDGKRWKRYYEVIAPGWTSSLESLKRYLELPPPDVKLSSGAV